ncbi:MAG: LCP family protein [Candidatus Portnoybacteria bacterium]|nr:LCP family protein [Candidatus Portnoybacteria bacterium]
MENQYEESDIYQEGLRPKKRRRFWLWLFILGAIVVLIGGGLFYKTSFTFSRMSVGNDDGSLLPYSENESQPEKDADRINILLLGLRGPDDPNAGLLTDTIILISIRKSTGQVAMVSIPRDLYLTMPGTISQKNPEGLKEKINFAYALGEEKKSGGGIIYAKAIVSRVTGLYIDYAVAVDFLAFKEVVDTLGGVDVYLDKPFYEHTQFAKEILIDLPAGKNHLNGDTALYFVRSRYSTSDFDRARRQQQVLMAVKDKALSLGFLMNPVKIFDMMDTLAKHVRTDMGMGEMNNLINLAKTINSENINRKVFDTTSEGLLYSSTSDKGAYILLPVGDNFDKIREVCKNIFQ